MSELLFKSPFLCSLCLHKLENPVDLECGHRMCLKDFSDLKNLQFFDKNIFNCPECKSLISEGKVKFDQLQMANVQFLYDIVCSWCGKEQAKYQCSENCNFLCEKCLKNLNSIEYFKPHSILDLNDLDKMKFITQKKCDQHKKYDLELYCKDCNILLCTLCALSGPHKPHNLISIDDFKKEKNMDFQLKLKLNKDGTFKYLEFYKSLLTKKEELDKNYEKCSKDIEKFFVRMNQILIEKRKSLIEEAAEIYQIKLDSWERNLKNLKSFMSVRDHYQEIFYKSMIRKNLIL